MARHRIELGKGSYDDQSPISLKAYRIDDIVWSRTRSKTAIEEACRPRRTDNAA